MLVCPISFSGCSPTRSAAKYAHFPKNSSSPLHVSTNVNKVSRSCDDPHPPQQATSHRTMAHTMAACQMPGPQGLQGPQGRQGPKRQRGASSESPTRSAASCSPAAVPGIRRMPNRRGRGCKSYWGWTNAISHHFDTVGNHLLVFTGESSFQNFSGGAGVRPSCPSTAGTAYSLAHGPTIWGYIPKNQHQPW